MEFLALKAANVQAIVVYAKENKDTKARNERLQERKAGVASGKIEQSTASMVESKRPFTWQGLVSSANALLHICG